MTSLRKEKMYVLGPLELSPGQFAVGERSYVAIKDNMPYYNSMRQEFYLKGDSAAGDAIGELETRALTAEKALEQLTAAKKSADKKIEDFTNDFVFLKKKYPEAIRNLEEFKEKKNKKNKEI